MVGGVCTGLGEYFNVDPVIIRIVFIVLAIQGGVGFIAYIVLWMVVPYQAPASAPAAAQAIGNDEEESVTAADPSPVPIPKRSNEKRNLYGGAILVALGLLFLLDNFLPSFGIEDFWPLILLAIGGSMLYNSYPRNSEETAS